MNFFNWNNKRDKTETRSNQFSSGNPITGTLKFSVFGNSAIAMKQGTVFRAVNLISDAIASLPLIPYNVIKDWKYIDKTTNLYNLLNVQPNPFMSAFTFKKAIITQILLKGNAFIVITRDLRTSEPTELTLLISDSVLIELTNGDIVYRDTLSGKIYDKTQVIHIMNYGSTLYRGESTISYMFNCLKIGQSLDNYMGSLASSGMMVSGILKPVSGAQITPAKSLQAKETFNSAVSNLESNSVIVLDSGFDFQQISISPKDAKYLESSKLNNNTICKFFGIPPSMLYDEVGKYSTAEQSQIDFLNNTLMPIIEKIESEFFRKLYLPTEWNSKELKFDTTNLMRLDAVTQANYFNTLFNMGALTVNEVRSKINAEYPANNGNKHFISTNLQELDNLIVNQIPPPIDNKLKNKKDNTVL